MCGFTSVFVTGDNQGSSLTWMPKVSESLKNISHRGPDASNILEVSDRSVFFAHARLSIIGVNEGAQPYFDHTNRYAIVFNGELYNYKEIKGRFSLNCQGDTDTEVVLLAFIKLGAKCLDFFRGMYAFAIWDEHEKIGFIARDRFGIKPLYYHQNGECVSFSSEIKGILPFLETKSICSNGLSDYINFQFTLSSRTLFQGVNEFPPAHFAYVKNGILESPRCYWRLEYNIDYSHTEKWFLEKLQELLIESVELHCTSDVPIASYVSGGIDSTLISALSSGLRQTSNPQGFVGRYTSHSGFDESNYAELACQQQGLTCNKITITACDFLDSFEKLIWHLDQPVAGPGSLGQYVVSEHASKQVKVILGGQGGDEIFGGYARYLLGYFEQCIKGAIDGTLSNSNYVVTYESIIPSLASLQQYKPLMKSFWSEGLFDPLDQRYWRLINRSANYKNILDFSIFDENIALQSFHDIFYADGTEHASYFDRMSHFDFRTLLPALLQVEDRVSMAHGLESRVPFLDHNLVEFAASIPADIKFKDGKLKRLIPLAFQDNLPKEILERKDKMGFPIPLNNWILEDNQTRAFVADTLSSLKARQRSYLSKPIEVDKILSSQGTYGRALWGLLCLEVWQNKFID